MWLGPVFLGPEPLSNPRIIWRLVSLFESNCGCEQKIVELTRLNYTRVCVQMKLEAVSLAACDATNNALVGLENAVNNVTFKLY